MPSDVLRIPYRMFHTPAQKAANTQSSGDSPRSAERAGPSLLNVTRSIGEREAGKTEPQAKSPANFKRDTTAHNYQESPVTPETRRVTVEPARPIKKPEGGAKYPNLTAEARACLNKAKLHLGNSRNLKTEIKTGVLDAINRLYELVKEAEKARGFVADSSERQESKETTDFPTAIAKQLVENLQQTNQALDEVKQQTRALSEQLKEAPRPTASQEPTFAEVVAAPRQLPHRPLHSVVVSSVDEFDTSDGVIGKLRAVVNATAEGTRVERLRKARDQKVIVGFTTRAEMAAVKERIRMSVGLRVEEVVNKDPLIILKDVLSCHTDSEVVQALKVQNAHLLGDVAAADLRMAVKYRRRTRNPHMGHIILQVSPVIWQRLTAAGRVHVDLQRLRVADQSPLIQCSICLGYGHGKKHCQDTIPLCSHCGDPHLRADCPAHANGVAPVCRNCHVAKSSRCDHSAFSSDCPMRAKWDSLARSSVAYC